MNCFMEPGNYRASGFFTQHAKMSSDTSHPQQTSSTHLLNDEDRLSDCDHKEMDQIFRKKSSTFKKFLLRLLAATITISTIVVIWISNIEPRYMGEISWTSENLDSVRVNYYRQLLKTSNLLKPKSKYSSVTCSSPARAGMSPRCLFSNVIVKGNVILFYQDENRSMPYLYTSALASIPDNILKIRSGPAFEPRFDIVNIQVVKGPMPETAVYMDYSPISTLMNPFWPTNQGHWLIDDLFASFSLMLEFGAIDENPHIVMLHGCKGMFNHNAGQLKHCKEFYVNRTPLFTKSVPTFLKENPYNPNSTQEIANAHWVNVFNSGNLAFQNLATGTSNFALTWGGFNRGSQWNLFRSIIVKNYGIVYKKPTSQVITIIRKTGRRVIRNFEEVEQFLRSKFDVSVQVYDPSIHTFQEQMDMITNCTLLISPPGGVSFLAGFLQQKSVGLFFDAWNYGGHSWALEGYWWEFLHAFNFARYSYTIGEARLHEGIEDPELLTIPIKLECGLPIDVKLTKSHFTPTILQCLASGYTDVMVDFQHLSTVVCDLLAITEVNYNLTESFNRSICL